MYLRLASVTSSWLGLELGGHSVLALGLGSWGCTDYMYRRWCLRVAAISLGVAARSLGVAARSLLVIGDSLSLLLPNHPYSLLTLPHFRQAVCPTYLLVAHRRV
jgi:hypothetical protein